MKSHENNRYLKHSHRKLPLSKNAGIKAAAGKYIAFLDSDDEYRPDYVEKRIMKANYISQVLFLNNFPDL